MAVVDANLAIFLLMKYRLKNTCRIFFNTVLVLLFISHRAQPLRIPCSGTSWRRSIWRRSQHDKCIWFPGTSPGVWCDWYHRFWCSSCGPGHPLWFSGPCPCWWRIVRWRNYWRRIWRSSCPGNDWLWWFRRGSCSSSQHWPLWKRCAGSCGYRFRWVWCHQPRTRSQYVWRYLPRRGWSAWNFCSSVCRHVQNGWRHYDQSADHHGHASI